MYLRLLTTLACLTISSNAQSQQEEIVNPKNRYSLLLTPSPFYLEPGIQYRRQISNKVSLQFRYSYKIFGYNSSANFDWNFSSYIGNLTGHGSIVRVGCRVKALKPTRKGNERFYEFRYTHKETSFPKYTYSEDPLSSLGVDYRQSEKRKTDIINIVLGRKIAESKGRSIEFAVIFGGAYLQKKITKYAKAIEHKNWTDIPPGSKERHESESFFYPSIGAGWTFYFDLNKH